MNKKFIATLVLASAGALASPAFASSGYGPAPWYDPIAGAPASQRGPSAQTLSQDAARTDSVTAYGGEPRARAESGSPKQARDAQSLFAHP